MTIRENSIQTVFPMDSADGELDDDGLPIYDRGYNAADLRRFFALLMTDGVYPDYLDELTPVNESGTWRVSAGAAVADGLLIPVGEAVPVVDQADIATGQYAYICVAARFDSKLRDGAVYARLSASSSEQPIRTDSVHELILARINWRGEMTDLRLDSAMCGTVQAVAKIDASSFLEALFTAVSQFNLNVGEVKSLPSGSTPTVTVRKPVTAGGEVYVDFGIPRGAPGEPGQSAPGLYIQQERPAAPAEGVIWMGTDPSTRQIEHIEAYEVTGTYPGEAYPGERYPGGTAAWAAYTINSALIAGSQI